MSIVTYTGLFRTPGRRPPGGCSLGMRVTGTEARAEQERQRQADEREPVRVRNASGHKQECAA